MIRFILQLALNCSTRACGFILAELSQVSTDGRRLDGFKVSAPDRAGAACGSGAACYPLLPVWTLALGEGEQLAAVASAPPQEVVHSQVGVCMYAYEGGGVIHTQINF